MLFKAHVNHITTDITIIHGLYNVDQQTKDWFHNTDVLGRITMTLKESKNYLRKLIY